MQDNKLMPGRKNILCRSAGLRAPDALGGQRPLNPLNLLIISVHREPGPDPGPFGLQIVGRPIIRKGRHDPRAQLVGLGMGQLQGGDFLQMIVQQPGVVEQRLQYQSLPPGDGTALAAHDRGTRQLGARDLIGRPVDGARACG